MPRRTPFEKAMHEMLFGEIKKERVPLPTKTRREVYEKAHKRCQCCGRPLQISQGVFHHLREPTAKSRPSTIQFLCSTDHKSYGHKRKTITKTELFTGMTTKQTYLSRVKVRKHPSSPYWKKTKSKTTKTRKRRKKKT